MPTAVNSRYFTADNLPPVPAVESGSGFNPHYRLDPLTDEVIRDGEDDLQSMIQAAGDSCNINRILQRYELTGDDTLLRQRAQLIADLSAAPGSLQEAYMLLQNVRQSFDALPADQKHNFNNFADFVLNFDKKGDAIK